MVKGYVKAASMGTNANTKETRAATQEDMARYRLLSKQEQTNFFKRFAKHNQSITRQLIKKFWPITFKEGSPEGAKSDAGDNDPKQKTDSVVSTSASANVTRPAATHAPAVGAATGAVEMKYGPSHKAPQVNSDGIIIDQ